MAAMSVAEAVLAFWAAAPAMSAKAERRASIVFDTVMLLLMS